MRIRYVVEPAPLGTAGGIKFASQGMTDTIVVFNGDVLTQIDLAAVIAMHRERHATRHDRPDAGGEPRRLRAGGNRRARQHPALHREAGPGADHHQLHQRRHLRARAVHLRPHPRRRGVVDRAQVLPVARRAGRDLRRLPATTATGSTSARPRSTPRSTATSWTAASMPRRSSTPAASRHGGGRATPWWRRGAVSKARASSTPAS